MAKYRNPYLERVYRDAGRKMPDIDPYPSYAYTTRRDAPEHHPVREARKPAVRRVRPTRPRSAAVAPALAFAASFLGMSLAARPADLGAILAAVGLADDNPVAAASTAGNVTGIGIGLLAVFAILRFVAPAAGGRRSAFLLALAVALGIGAGLLLFGQPAALSGGGQG